MFQLFKSVLLLSGVGAALTVILLLIKPFAKKHFSSAWRYYIWLVALIVMILPVRLPKKAVEVDLSGIKESTVTEETAYIMSEPLPYIETGNDEPVPVAEVEQRGVKLNIYDVIPIIWLGGSGIFMLCLLISYWKFLFARRKCPVIADGYTEFYDVKDKFKIKREILLKKSDDVAAPMLVGVFKPVIYVPDREIEREELKMIFMHELTHYKRRDLWYKWFSLAVNALHWFNPFIYVIVRNINELCELSCDVSVTKDMTDDEKKKYMNTIIGLLEKGDKENV